MDKRLSTLLLSLSLALGLAMGGCAEKSVPVEFYGFCGFPVEAATCLPPAGKCGTYQNGQLYLYYQNDSSLDMVSEFHNQRPDNSDRSLGVSNTANAIITSFRYKFTTSPPVALAARTVPVLTTPIASSGTSTLWIPVLPPETVTELQAAAGNTSISVELTAAGRYGDGSTFEVAPFTVPVLALKGAPAAYVCPKATDAPAFCPSEFQTHSVACGAGTSPTGFTLAGTITNLSTSGLVLTSPGLGTLTIASGDTTFTFGTTLADGASYNVTVATQPTGQNCIVSNGTGVVSGASVLTVSVSCI